MTNNLIPPFLMREAGVVVNDTPKIHTEDPGIDNHTLWFPDQKARMPLQLNGIFSYFPTDKPSSQDIDNCDPSNVLHLSPKGGWDPHNSIHAQNEANMTDFEGEMVEERHRTRISLSKIPDEDILSEHQISGIESQIIDKVFEHTSAHDVDKLTNLEQLLLEQNEDALFMASIGATVPCTAQCPLDENDTSEMPALTSRRHTHESDDDDSDSDSDSEDSEEDSQGSDSESSAFQFESEQELDDFMASATTAGRPSGVTPEHPSKTWRIDSNTAKRTLDVTSQNKTHVNNPDMTRNCSTNDRMLRCKRIKERFFMDTFTATSKGGKSSRGHTCVQLFVTDKGFVHVIPMKTRSEVFQAVKQFAKETGAPEAIMCDPMGEHSSQQLKKFCNDTGTSLKHLEEHTPWANEAESYIVSMKEAVRKDMKESDGPIRLWDCCVER